MRKAFSEQALAKARLAGKEAGARVAAEFERLYGPPRPDYVPSEFVQRLLRGDHLNEDFLKGID